MTRKKSTPKPRVEPTFPSDGAAPPAKAAPPKRRAGAKPPTPVAAKTTAKGRRFVFPWRGILVRGLALLLPFGLFFAGYLIHLDVQIQAQFAGKRWAEPARVYGRPLELYPHAPLTVDDLAEELARLGYIRVQEPRHSGEWSLNGERALIATRPFQFWDEERPGIPLEVRFTKGRIAGLRNPSTGQGLSLFRLEAPEIGSIHPAQHEDRVLLRRSELPKTLVNALLEMEDRAFYDHPGVNPIAITRALVVNLWTGEVAQGGSTLTQQLVKNFFLTNERTLVRKVREALMAMTLEARYTKDDILEAYANEIFLAQDGSRAIHGFGLGSRFYFGRPLRELDLPRLALLVAVIRGPTYYNPRQHPDRALERRNLVLKTLHERGHIDAELLARAQQAPLGVTDQNDRPTAQYPAFMDLVKRQLERDYRRQDLVSEGLRVFTSLDPALQRATEQAMATRLAALEKEHRLPTGKLEGAAVLLDAQHGEVLALAGGRQAGYEGFNRALDAVRPIGSLVKPAIYLTALARPERYNLISRIDDSPVTVKTPQGPWSPQNYDKRAHGSVTLYDALANSYNLSTARLGLDLGVKEVIRTLQALGVEREMQPYPSLLLGSVSLTPIEVAQTYQTLAAGGYRAPLRAIREVQDSRGRRLQRYPLRMERAFAAGPVHLLNWAMQRVVSEGTARSLTKYVPARVAVAGKTGTTDDMRDSWFAGFSGDKVLVVWTGRDDNQPAKLSGATGALQVWGDIMSRIGPEALVMSAPEGVDYQWVNAASRTASARDCPGAIRVPFVAGHGPAETGGCGETPAAEAPSSDQTSLLDIFR